MHHTSSTKGENPKIDDDAGLRALHPPPPTPQQQHFVNHGASVHNRASPFLFGRSKFQITVVRLVLRTREVGERLFS